MEGYDEIGKDELEIYEMLTVFGAYAFRIAAPPNGVYDIMVSNMKKYIVKGNGDLWYIPSNSNNTIHVIERWICIKSQAVLGIAFNTEPL